MGSKRKSVHQSSVNLIIHLSEDDGALVGAVDRCHEAQDIRPGVPLRGVAPVGDGGGDLDIVLSDKVDEVRRLEVLARELLHPACRYCIPLFIDVRG